MRRFTPLTRKRSLPEKQRVWQLFVATSDHFSRTVDRDRLHASDEALLLEQVRQQAAWGSDPEKRTFPGGISAADSHAAFPRRIAAHFALYQQSERSRIRPNSSPHNTASRLR